MVRCGKHPLKEIIPQFLSSPLGSCAALVQNSLAHLLFANARLLIRATLDDESALLSARGSDSRAALAGAISETAVLHPLLGAKPSLSLSLSLSRLVRFVPHRSSADTQSIDAWIVRPQETRILKSALCVCAPADRAQLTRAGVSEMVRLAALMRNTLGRAMASDSSVLRPSF